LIEEEVGATASETNALVTVKFVVEFAELPLTVTEIRPVLAPDGTATVRVVTVAALIIAATPLNRTAFEDGVVLKP